ncbi:hypothetical protein [Cohnella rhizosphaerae]|uniref:Uncharacterized protein n=1 Tax=Cohnella rhizosphaerae TaxID=1457232 RepID=A0A9X4KQ65_9BACL|nr:hypothetical protein [Cohnella rhizosphaerae]MDG0808653.1 hypothetical protein [Cohnella rhizosphaerae]
MKWTARFRGTAKNQMSLFYTLFGSFIAIILLLVSINWVAFTFFRQSIRDEIILNSSLNLNATAANYEKHIKLVRSFMLGSLFDNDTEILKRGDPMRRYDVVVDVQKSLAHNLNNTSLYLDNIVYYFRGDDFIIDRDGTRDADTMFSKFYYEPSYTADFWRREMDGEESFKVYPAGSFASVTPFERKPLGTLLPILVKNGYDHDFAFIAFLNADRIYAAFHQAKPDSTFYIVDGGGRALFSSGDGLSLPSEVAGKSGKGYVKIDDSYYFYRTGGETGFAYVEKVSDKGLAAQLSRLNLIMMGLLALSVLIGLAVSYWFSKRFHNPLANMIRSVQSLRAVGVPAGEGEPDQGIQPAARHVKRLVALQPRIS